MGEGEGIGPPTFWLLPLPMDTVPLQRPCAYYTSSVDKTDSLQCDVRVYTSICVGRYGVLVITFSVVGY